MRYFGKSQADMCRMTGWSKATMSDIYNGRTLYYREIVNQVATALEVHPFELLMPPDEAFALRRLRQSALQIAAETRTGYTPPPPGISAPVRKAG
jgi:transcriptional regulator with XRE-family HTH domain